jgi:hypothetical protein
MLTSEHDPRNTSNKANPALVRQALDYAALGLRVIPLYGRSKTPRIERWPERGTVDKETITTWFERWPDSNIAILTGGDLIALDVDVRNGGRGSFRKLMKGRRMPQTAQALTGSGGSHYLFRVDPELAVKNIGGLLPGIDIKGENGSILVEPSIHPTIRKEYVWLSTPQQGIAEAPAWLLRMLPRSADVAGPRSAQPVTCDRIGDLGGLLAEAIARFPVAACGQRNAQMTRLVASLLGRGYIPDLVEAVVAAWWGHYYAEGTIRTPPAGGKKVVRANIECTLKNPKFRRSVGVDHLAHCREIRLSREQERLMGTGGFLQEAPALATPLSNRVTQVHALCRTAQEKAFVEAWVVYFSYKLFVLGEKPLKATRDQIVRIIEDRHGLKLENPQFERLKKKYITREGKPATIFELAIQTREGRQGVPSEFEPTGILQLIHPGAAVGLAG